MRWRTLSSVIVAALSLLVATPWAQQSTKVPVVGLLMVAAGPSDSVVEALRDGLRGLGYVEGRNFRFEHRSADGHRERLTGLAEELVRLKVDVIVTATDAATRAAKQATTSIPIVVNLPEDDPVAAGFIESFNHPGGNVTGLTVRNSQLVGKRLELLKQILPGLSRVAVFSDPLVRGELEMQFDHARPVADNINSREQLVRGDQLQQYAGVAPVLERSGNKRWVHWRMACPTFLRQTFVEWAGSTIPRSFWASAYYQRQRDKGCSHQAALRALAYKRIRIVYRCWQTRTTYDESAYLQAFKRRGSRLLAAVAAAPPSA